VETTQCLTLSNVNVVPVDECVQKSDLWHQRRHGKITGSRLGALLGYFGQKARSELYKTLIHAQKNNQINHIHTNDAMEYGTAMEPVALNCYLNYISTTTTHATYYEVTLSPIPGMEHHACATSDGVIAIDDGPHAGVHVIEIKAPYSNGKKQAHKKLPANYVPQLMMESTALEVGLICSLYLVLF
jgi:hypothetical protein